MAQEAAGWCPPNAQELLEASIPDGSQWYEVRTSWETLSYEVDRYDDALKDAKVQLLPEEIAAGNRGKSFLAFIYPRIDALIPSQRLLWISL